MSQQFGVYRDRVNPKGPLLLDVQSDLIAQLTTRVVVPLYPLRNVTRQQMTSLTPTFTISGKRYLMQTPRLAGISVRDIGDQVGDLSDRRNDIVSAIDLLFTGI